MFIICKGFNFKNVVPKLIVPDEAFKWKMLMGTLKLKLMITIKKETGVFYLKQSDIKAFDNGYSDLTSTWVLVLYTGCSDKKSFLFQCSSQNFLLRI